jgi:predicted PurR-regulated permease PerM
MNTPVRLPRTWRAGELALVILAIVGVIAAAKAAEAFLVPVTAGILIAYALKPLVNGLERYRIPRPVGATLVLAALSGLFVGAGTLVKDDTASALAELPDAARKLRIAARETARKPENPIGHVREAAAELTRAAAEAVGTPHSTPAGTTVSALQAWSDAQPPKIFTAFADLGMAALLALFLLAAGGTFRRKIVQLVGPTLSARRVTVEILNEIDTQVQRYLLVLLVTNVLIALGIWLLLMAVGMERAAMWGSIAGVLHIIPYVGTALTTLAVGIAAFLQFDSLGAAVATSAAVLLLSVAIGVGLVTWLQGRASHMSPVAVFVALLFFGWLWGAWGLLLGAPLVAIFKTIADRVPALAPFGALLGR